MNEKQIFLLKNQCTALEKAIKRHSLGKNTGIVLCILFAMLSINDKAYMIYLIVFLISYTLSEFMYQSAKQHRNTLLILLDQSDQIED